MLLNNFHCVRYINVVFTAYVALIFVSCQQIATLPLHESKYIHRVEYFHPLSGTDQTYEASLNLKIDRIQYRH